MTSQPASRPLLHLGHGLLMGSADVVPGVSGGTVALVVGIYERLIRAIRDVVESLILLLRGHPADARRRLAAVEWGLVGPLAAGILLALAVGSFVIPVLLERYPVAMLALFFGLVLASVPIPYRRMRRVGAAHGAIVLAAAAIAFLLVGLPASDGADPGALQVFLSASVAICAMILPGVSGAFLLKAMGMYEVTLSAVRHLDVVYILTFGAGAAVGLALFAKLLGRLLERYHDRTMAALVGLMVGALRALWPWQRADRGLELPALDASIGVALGLAVLGFAAVTLLTRHGHRRPEDVPLP